MVLLLLACIPVRLLSAPPPEPVMSGVTPGAVSPAIFHIRPHADAPHRLTLFTEDRHGQMIDPSVDEAVISRVTGLRRVHVGVREPGDTVVVVGDRGRLYRFDPWAERTTVVRTLPGEVEQMWRDGRGNFLARTRAGVVMHLSAAGTLLWEARPGGGVVAGEWIHGRVVLRTADGGLVQVDESGAAIPLVPPPESGTVQVVGHSAARIREGGAPALVVVTNDGSVERWEQQRILQDSAGNLTVSSRRLWRWEPPGEGNTAVELLGTDGGGHHWVLVGEREVYVITPGGELRGAPTHWHEPIVHRVLEVGRGVLWVVDPRGGVQTIDGAGVISERYDLAGVPRGLQYAPGSGTVVVLHNDWRYQLFQSTTPRLTQSAIAPVPIPIPANTSATAPLRSLADTALRGTSLSEREALLRVIQERMNRRVLAGQVVLVQDILLRLATEPYRGGGPDLPAVRGEAVRLLGFFADDATRRELTRIVEQDPSALVVSRALRELARFPRDQHGAVPGGVERFRTSQRSPDRNMIAAGLVAYLEELPRDRNTMRAAGELEQSDIPLELRRRAQQLRDP